MHYFITTVHYLYSEYSVPGTWYILGVPGPTCIMHWRCHDFYLLFDTRAVQRSTVPGTRYTTLSTRYYCTWYSVPGTRSTWYEYILGVPGPTCVGDVTIFILFDTRSVQKRSSDSQNVLVLYQVHGRVPGTVHPTAHWRGRTADTHTHTHKKHGSTLPL